MKIISSNIVQGANQESSRIHLTPWDLRLLPVGHIQKGLLFPKPTPDLQEKETDEDTLIHHLKASLSKTLDYFPPLAGRLATVEHEEDDTISYFIDCNNADALFIHAAAYAISISNIIEPVYVPQIVHSFFPLDGLKNYEGVSNPLLGIQVTNLADGIFIGCTINHCVSDGSSFWHFLNSWSEISKGSIPLSKLPVFQCWLPNGIDHLPVHIPKSSLKQVYAQELVLPPLQERVFHFTKENIAKLKAKANAERLQELPDGYFGNAVLDELVTVKAKEVLKQGIVRSGSANKFDGKITLFCGVEEGSIDIEACLSPEALEAMGNDEEFMDSVAL
ncbi:Transferase [Corchorus olitorius]|uniref:Transferase n=1 Tax=Corchorus olitorius TaxID=93759 RepID=A0A1R3GJ45_9ROSI|nr:Transferase [Corchorus olitorius]